MKKRIADMEPGTKFQESKSFGIRLHDIDGLTERKIYCEKFTRYPVIWLTGKDENKKYYPKAAWASGNIIGHIGPDGQLEEASG